MRKADQGLKSETLRAALALAVKGNTRQLEDLLCRHGGGSDRRPNLRLAAAFGVEIAAFPVSPRRLLSKLGSDDAAPDDARVFLPIAAAHGWVALLRANRDDPEAWAALGDLASDERRPVRAGTLDAMSLLALRDGGARTLVDRALDWLRLDDLEKRFAAAALVVEVLGDRRATRSLAADSALLDYLSRVIQEVADAPRSAGRMEERRRLLTSLPPTLATVVATMVSDDRGPAWFEAICTSSEHPDVRNALSDAILRLRSTPLGHGSAIAQRLRQALEGSAKPLRDPSRLRPGSGRGKTSRPMR
jgi:hypothetical protein